jgi:hypothetical protein
MSALMGVDRKAAMQRALWLVHVLLVYVADVVRRRGNECRSLTVAVLVPGECVLTVIHCNVDISTSGVGELFLCHGGLCYHQWLCRRAPGGETAAA